MSVRRTVRLGEILKPVHRPIAIAEGGLHTTLGVRWYGAGCFVKTNTPVKAKTLNRVAVGDVVYSKLFAWKGSFGVVPDSMGGVFASNEFPTFEAHERLLPEYFELWAGRSDVWETADALSTGTTGNSRNRLSPDDFLDLDMDLPPLDEQKAVVGAVETVSTARNARARETHALWRLLASLREERFHTAEDWEELPAGWTLTRLRGVAEIRSGIAKGRKTSGGLVDAPFIRAANVQDGFLNAAEMKTLAVSATERARFQVRTGDVLMTEGGNAEHVGRGWLWGGAAEGAVHQNHVFRARVNRELIEPRFLAYAIGASPARAYCLESAKRTTNLASINKAQISELPVPLPTLDEQRQIVRQLDAARRAAINCQLKAASLGRLRAALIEEFVSGARAAPRIA